MFSDTKLLVFVAKIIFLSVNVKGMEHLESKQIVHRDLAARNVLGMFCGLVALCFTLVFCSLMCSFIQSTICE